MVVRLELRTRKVPATCWSENSRRDRAKGHMRRLRSSRWPEIKLAEDEFLDVIADDLRFTDKYFLQRQRKKLEKYGFHIPEG